jgi:hypothetical protein
MHPQHSSFASMSGLLAGGMICGLAAIACSQGSGFEPNYFPPDPVFTNPTDISNSYLPLAALNQDILLGTESGDSVRVVRTRSTATRTFTFESQTVAAVIIIDSVFVEGALDEVALDYIAQADDGTVYYFGEDVDLYQGGVVVSHDGSWLYGGAAKNLGILMPAQPRVGDRFLAEDAAPVTVEKDEIVSDTATVTVPAGTYVNCVKIKEVSNGEVEYKYYAAGIGVVDEVPPEGRVSLASHN